MLVYLDTSAWSALYDKKITRRILAKNEILFSSCNLDEISIASPHRARDLAKFAWSASNQRKLLDHLEFTAKEMRAHQDAIPLTELYDRSDPAFFEAWRAIRTTGLTEAMRAAMQARSDYAKRTYRDWLRVIRRRFAHWFGPTQFDDLQVAWGELLAELEAEGYVNEMLDGILRAGGFRGFPGDVPYRELPATSCWVQYHIALGFVAGHASRKVARPDLGDQADFRHACYAGVVDVFVSDDQRMRTILGWFVRDKRAEVLSPGGYIETLRPRE